MTHPLRRQRFPRGLPSGTGYATSVAIYARRCQTKAWSTKLPLDAASERARIGAFRLQHPELGQSNGYPLVRMPLRWRAHLWTWRVAPLFSSPPYYLEPSAGPGPRSMWETYRQRFQCHLGLGFPTVKRNFGPQTPSSRKQRNLPLRAGAIGCRRFRSSSLVLVSPTYAAVSRSHRVPALRSILLIRIDPPA